MNYRTAILCAALLAPACDGTISSQPAPGGQKVETAYQKLADYTRGTSEPLAIQINNLRQYNITEVQGRHVSELMTLPDSLLSISVNGMREPRPSLQLEATAFQPNLTEMRQKWDQAFLSDMFKDTDHSIANVTAVYAYDVAITLSDRTLAYQAVALENALDPQHELWFVDGVVGDLYLNMALQDERPNAADLPPLEQDTTVPYSCSGGFWGPVLNVGVSNGWEHDRGGTHGINGWVRPYCSYYPFYGHCYTRCRMPGYSYRWWDSGDTSWHWHCIAGIEGYDDMDGPGNIACAGALGIAVTSQPWPCGTPSIGIQVWNFGASVSPGGSLWNGTRTAGFTCPGR